VVGEHNRQLRSLALLFLATLREQGLVSVQCSAAALEGRAHFCRGRKKRHPGSSAQQWAVLDAEGA
jgi:hypothetical protein